MENRPPQQDTPRKPPTNSGRKTNGSGGSPTPPWLWLLLLGGFALIFWQFVPKQEVQVLYYPWFYEQVQADNIKSISVQGDEIRGELRKKQTYKNPSTQASVDVTKFITYLPPEPAIPIVDALIKHEQRKVAAEEKKAEEGKADDKTKSAESRKTVVVEKSDADVVKIDPIPANSANSLAWILFLLPTFVVLVFFYLMMRRARDQFDGGILGSFVKSPAKRHDKSKQRTTFDEVAGLENAKSELQEIVEFSRIPRSSSAWGAGFPRECS